MLNDVVDFFCLFFKDILVPVFIFPVSLFFVTARWCLGDIIRFSFQSAGGRKRRSISSMSSSRGMMKEACSRNCVSTRHTTASRCQGCVRPHLSAVKTRRLNAPLCLNLSCWLYGNDASQAKHNKPLASSACRQQRCRAGDHTSVWARSTCTGDADQLTNMKQPDTRKIGLRPATISCFLVCFSSDFIVFYLIKKPPSSPLKGPYHAFLKFFTVNYFHIYDHILPLEH